MRLVYLFWVTVVSMAVASSALALGFGNHSFVGRYGYTFAGNFGSGLAGSVVETGVITSDGNGNATAVGQTVINGNTHVMTATYACTYTVQPNGSAAFGCTRDDGNAVVNVDFAGALVDRGRELKFIALPSQAPFDVVNVSGSARSLLR